MSEMRFKIGNTRTQHVYGISWGEGKALMHLAEHLHLMAELGRETTVLLKRGWTNEQDEVLPDLKVSFSELMNLGVTDQADDPTHNTGYSEAYRRMFTRWEEERIFEIRTLRPTSV